MRQTFCDYTFSFGKMNEKANRIPFVCKEAFPRQYDKKWYEKLLSKIKVMPLIAEKRPDVFKGLTKKEVRKGCKDMFDFAVEEVGQSVFEIAQITYDLHKDPLMNAGNIMTEYEEKFSKKGNKICKYILRRRA